MRNFGRVRGFGGLGEPFRERPRGAVAFASLPCGIALHRASSRSGVHIAAQACQLTPSRDLCRRSARQSTPRCPSVPGQVNRTPAWLRNEGALGGPSSMKATKSSPTSHVCVTGHGRSRATPPSANSRKTVSRIRPTVVGQPTLFPQHGNAHSDWEQCARSRSEAVAKLRQGYGQGSVFDTVNTRVRVTHDEAC